MAEGPAATNTVGEVNVAIGADLTGLKAGVAAGVSTAVAGGAEMEAALGAAAVQGNSLNQSAKELAKNIKSNVGGVISLTKVLSSTLHLLGKWIGLVGLIGAGVWGIVKAWDAVVASATKAADKAGEHQAEVAKTNDLLLKLNSTGKNAPVDPLEIRKRSMREEVNEALKGLDAIEQAERDKLKPLNAESTKLRAEMAASDRDAVTGLRGHATEQARLNNIINEQLKIIEKINGAGKQRESLTKAQREAEARIDDDIAEKRLENERKIAAERLRLYQQFEQQILQGTNTTSGPNDATRLLADIAANIRRGQYIRDGSTSYGGDI